MREEGRACVVGADPASPSTINAEVTTETVSAKVNVVSVPTASVTSRAIDAKTPSETVTRSEEGRSATARYSPQSLDRTICDRPFAALVRLTETPCTRAPDSSTTVPASVAPTACPYADEARPRTETARASSRHMTAYLG